MRTDTALAPTFLRDYQPFPFGIDSVHLAFDLDPAKTTVTNTMSVTRRHPGQFILQGEDIRLVSVSVNGDDLPRSAYTLDQKTLTLDIPDQADITITTTCEPKSNTSLMGLYVSGGRFCTQCEAEGFRRITYYPDRPDVMSVFTTTITAPLGYPYLLSNGNLVSESKTDTHHTAVWNDPFPKPAYLFALVAGEFDVLRDTFTTMSGRDIALEIYIDPGQLNKAEYALDSLKRAMRWDETAYGREYDLDRFMVVAVRDFNFGAMENKGLNIFNSSLLAANARTATDLSFERIESVVAHEYFHNWTGNRITCRDWFQLCLKEGFTVFRDQQFSADQRDPTVQRIKDVKTLRARQFAEDAGPLSHAVRPESFVKIDNFYTATIYEKGAEIIRMIHTLLGHERFRKGSDAYFDVHDGRAATVEDFLESFGQGAGYDLSPFKLWYSQAGTPVLTVSTERTEDLLRITLAQRTDPTPGQPQKHPLPIPVRYQIIGEHGPVGDSSVHLLDRQTDTLEVALPADTGDITLSVLQGFSAPVRVEHDLATADTLRLMAHDPDGFSRWEAGQTIAKSLVRSIAYGLQHNRAPAPDRALSAYTHALRVTLQDLSFGDAFKALVLAPPAQLSDYLGSQGLTDPVAVAEAVTWLERAIGEHLADDLLAIYEARPLDSSFDPGADAAGRRSLRNRALSLLASANHPQAAPLAISQFSDATNMTDELAALVVLTRLGGRRVDYHLAKFREKYDDEPLVIDRWFSVQAARNHSEGIGAIKALTERDDYTRTNPNRVRATLGALGTSNARLFHHHGGAGYRFMAEEILDMETRNPQIAARLLGMFEIWPQLDPARQQIVTDVLYNIARRATSDNVREIAERLRGATTS